MRNIKAEQTEQFSWCINFSQFAQAMIISTVDSIISSSSLLMQIHGLSMHRSLQETASRSMIADLVGGTWPTEQGGNWVGFKILSIQAALLFCDTRWSLVRAGRSKDLGRSIAGPHSTESRNSCAGSAQCDHW